MSGFNKTFVIEIDSINDDFDDFPDCDYESINDLFAYVQDAKQEVRSDIFWAS